MYPAPPTTKILNSFIIKKTFTALWKHFIFLVKELFLMLERKENCSREQMEQGITLFFGCTATCEIDGKIQPFEGLAKVVFPLTEKLLIADDTINPKREEKIELVSYLRDHTIGRTILAMSHLVLSYFDGRATHSRLEPMRKFAWMIRSIKKIS